MTSLRASSSVPAAAAHVELSLSGHLDLAQLEQRFAELESSMPSESVPLLVDATRMTGYDVDARERFIVWNRQHKSQFFAVAIVTGHLRWHMVIRAMALASSQKLCPFTDRATALNWCAAQRDAARA